MAKVPIPLLILALVIVVLFFLLLFILIRTSFTIIMLNTQKNNVVLYWIKHAKLQIATTSRNENKKKVMFCLIYNRRLKLLLMAMSSRRRIKQQLLTWEFRIDKRVFKFSNTYIVLKWIGTFLREGIHLLCKLSLCLTKSHLYEKVQPVCDW